MTPFPHLKETSQEAEGTPGVKKFQRKLQMNFKVDFFLRHPVYQPISDGVVVRGHSLFNISRSIKPGFNF